MSGDWQDIYYDDDVRQVLSDLANNIRQSSQESAAYKIAYVDGLRAFYRELRNRHDSKQPSK